MGRDACPARSRATSSPCSGPGCAACRRAPRRRTRAPGSCWSPGYGPRDARAARGRARSFGADLTVDVAVDDPVKALRARDRRRLADVVVDVTAKAPAALGQAVALARPGGTVVLAGTRGSDETPGFAPDHVVYKELRLLGALGVDATAYEAALDMLAARAVPVRRAAREMCGLDGVEDLVRLMAGEADGTPPVHAVRRSFLTERIIHL